MKRIVSMLLVLAMLAPCFPVRARAVEEEATAETQIPGTESVVETVEETAVVEPPVLNTNQDESGFRYTVDEASGTATVTGYSGSETELTIPATLGDYPVTAIGNKAFYSETWNPSNLANIARIIIPDGVTSIGDRAFWGCSHLASITLPDGVTSIGSAAFYYCRSLTGINIPESVTFIGVAAFQHCSNLTEITIPNGITSIDDATFIGCKSLSEITIPDSVTSIGVSSFQECTSLTSLALPDSVTSIGDYAFQHCSSLSSITIPDSVTSISDGTFKNCSGLAGIAIPGSVTSIGEFAFSGCGNLTSIALPEDLISIGGGAFSGCSDLTSITIPDSVTSIGEFAFSDCSNLASIIISNGVASIGEWTFSACSMLTSITIPSSVTSICNYAFQNCTRLIDITIQGSVTSIGEHAFVNCCSLTDFTIQGTVSSIGNYAFQNCGSLTDITIPNGITSIGKYTFSGCSSLTNITIPDGVTSIGDNAFRNCYDLTSVTIPDGVTSIQSNTFDGCSSLTDITLPDGITSIGDSAFYGCSSLSKLSVSKIASVEGYALEKGSAGNVLPSRLVSIGNSAFYGCKKLSRIIIPESVTSIGGSAFEGCTNLTIYGEPGSAAEAYAKENEIIFREDSGTDIYDPTITRIAGASRYLTAITAADTLKGILGVGKFQSIVIASGTNFADALAGSYLAAQKQAPILLSTKKSDADNLKYIQDNLSSDGTVYILGGTTAVSDSIETMLKTAGINVKRLAGKDRYKTNLLILEEAGFSGGEVLVAIGNNFADSLSASATGKPILLVGPKWDKISSDYVNYLSSKTCSFTIIGGTGAVKEAIENDLKNYGSVRRIFGSNRLQTSVTVAQTYFASPDAAVLACSTDFPDGLCGGPLAYALGAPLLLVNSGKEAAAAAYVAANGIQNGYIMGGEAVVSEASANTVFDIS